MIRKKLLNVSLTVAAMVFALSSFSSAQAALEPAQVLEKIRDVYAKITDASATFTEEVKFKYSNIQQSLSGELEMKQENKYRIQTDQQTVVTDGKTVWSYSPINKQVLIDDYKENAKTFSPDRFLFSVPTDFQAVFLNEKTSSNEVQSLKEYALKLIPRAGTSSAAAVKSLKIWVAGKDWSIRKVEYVDMNETQRTYTVHSLSLNTGLPDSNFSFTVPSGVQIVDLRVLKAKARRQ
jgi:chaperone LolA